MPFSVFTIESVTHILAITKESGTIAHKTSSPFVQFISREISQATSSLTFSTRNSIFGTRSSRLETPYSKLSRIESRGSRDCQLTFERYCISRLRCKRLISRLGRIISRLISFFPSQTVLVNVLLGLRINILLSKLSRSAWKDLDLGHVYRQTSLISVCTHDLSQDSSIQTSSVNKS